ncbi:MAG: DUF883 domain-containing protein [Proteobacteria bacterium]|nr:DUF883 domain-containing protein [Pseudomonadota bacterium]
MKKHTQGISRDLSEIVGDLHTLLNATADVAEDAVAEARKRLSAALETGKDVYGRLEDEVSDGAKAADKVVRSYPYHAVGIAFCVGALLGFLMSSRD